MTGPRKEAGTSKEEETIKKLEEQVGILQIQFSSHGGDIREIKARIGTILQGQEEMRGISDHRDTDGKRGGRRYEYRHRNIDMPSFDGKDPDGWILQAERYFDIYGLINEEMVEAAVLSLSEDALSWFLWSDKQRRITT
ncbi:hypothetical protein LXL04_023231 [Taraxacum kok-saghyz]